MDFYFGAGCPLGKAACVVYHAAVCRKLKVKAVPVGNKLGKGALFGNGGAVCGVYSGNKLFKAGNAFVKLNKKVKVLARKSALSYKAQENAVVVVEDFTFEAPKTKDFVNITKNLKVEGKKTLVVLPESNKNVYLSARNLKGSEVILASAVNTYKVLNADVLVVTENSLKVIDEILMK